MNESRDKWDHRYRESPGQHTVEPARILAEYVHLLPPKGRALDLACGLGGNALLLARQGLETHAWDLSSVAIDRLREVARERGCVIHCQVRDVVAVPPEVQNYDVITVSHFLERALTSAIIAALKPGGLLFYQTFTRIRVDDTGPSNPAYRLGVNELLDLFAPLRLLVYREEGLCGDPSRGFRNEAMLVGQKTGP